MRNASGQNSNILTEFQQKQLVEHVCYALSGFDTSSIYLEGSPPGLKVTGLCHASVEPFEYLIFKTREYYYREDTLPFIEKYLKKISILKDTILTPEELYVKLGDDIAMFQALDKIGSHELSISTDSIENMNSNHKKHSVTGIMKYFNDINNKRVIKSIEKWINDADKGDIIEEKSYDRFDSCFWKNKFKIKNIKNIGKLQHEAIEECGKIVYLMRNVFGVEVIADGKPVKNGFFVDEEGEDYGDQRLMHKIKGIDLENNKKLNISAKNPLDGTSMAPCGEEYKQGGLENTVTNTNKAVSKPAVIYPEGNLLNNVEQTKVNEDLCVNNAGVENIEFAGTGVDPIKDHLSNKIIFKETYKPKITKLPPINLTNNISLILLVNQRRFELTSILNGSILKNVHFELAIIYDILFMQDFSFHLEIFDEFSSQFLLFKNPVIVKMNTFALERYSAMHPCFPDYVNEYENILKTISRSKDPSVHCGFNSSKCVFDCLLSNVSFSEYVLRLLNNQSIPKANDHLNILERFSFSMNPGFLQLFLPPKTFTEIKIISRFLFLTNAIIYYLERSPKYNFTRVIFLVFMHIKNYEIKNPINRKCINKKCVNSRCIQSEDNINDIVEALQEQVDGLLNLYFLTNGDVFIHLSNLIDVSMEYIQTEFKEHVDTVAYDKKVKRIIASLLTEIIKNSDENDFTGFLQRFKL